MTGEKKKQYTLDEVSKNNTEDSCWMIIGNMSNGGPKVYDVTKYLDDHPGGAEVMLDVAGQDADEFFEDIGHSADAREELKRHLIGDLLMDDATKAKMKADAEKALKKKEGSLSPVLMIVLVAILAIGAKYYMSQS
uniref:Cytochrome b5 heme-binding domain-containing protein n=1 Tax=Thalassionema nitzschioides TaxID=33649 RepID=A0A7S1E0H8_9STRA|mmetsp:Transcript_14703/g.21689  ORF Transcript_14703/g.21689 Transcript_14703/m.21689 type:complete len:136 (+) Transcript_14703:69-476(+)